MASLYPRKGRLWLCWFENGERQFRSTGLPLHEREKALELKKELEREVAARKDLGLPMASRRTVGGYRRAWLDARKKAKLACAGHDEARLRHATELDGLSLREVRPRHIRDLVVKLKGTGLAPRTVRHVFFLLRQMFRDAQVDELVDANPCVLPKGVLPPKKDKNPSWRATAIYTREEVQTLISDTRIPEDRRTLYALLFLTGCRVGEMADRRWRDYDAEREPLGSLHVHSSFDTRTKKPKEGPKSGVAREVPVHPVLAKVLAAWKLGGWARMMARNPGLEDLIIPTGYDGRGKGGRQRTSNHVRNKLLADLARVGLRARRAHDTRRTFISLGLADGGRKEILRWVSHGPTGDVMDLYTTLPWATLCGEVAKLNIRTVKTATPQLHRAQRKNGH